MKLSVSFADYSKFPPNYWKWLAIALLILLAIVIYLWLIIPDLEAREIDLSIIAKIESSNNPLAYNPKSKARGLYQISEIALKDYNDWHPTFKIASNALYSPIEARKVAEWYLGIRIPSFLKLGGWAPKIDYVLICYNFGYGNFKKWYRQGGDYSKLPRETQKYLIKYYKLAKER